MTEARPCSLETGVTLVPDAPAAEAAAIGARLAAIYEAIVERSMRELPIYNAALRVEAIGFRAHGDRVVGVLATPWFMNLVVTSRPGGADLPPSTAGASVTHGFPGGDFDCVVGEIDGFGRLDSASLFSPMFRFDDPEVVRAVGEAVIEEVFRAPVEAEVATAREAPAPAPPALDRRALLFGRRRAEEDPSCR